MVDEDDYNQMTDERDEARRECDRLESIIAQWESWAEEVKSSAADNLRDLENLNTPT